MKIFTIMFVAVLALGSVMPDAVAQEPRAQGQSPQDPAAQNTTRRSMKLAVRNKRGRVMVDLPLVARLKGDDKTQTLDRFGNTFFNVSDADTLVLSVADEGWEFPLVGLDSVYVVLKNRHRVAGYATSDSGGELLDVGYGTVSRRNNVASVSHTDMKGAETYTDLRSYLSGRVAGLSFIGDRAVIRGFTSVNGDSGPLFVVDGVAINGSFSTVNTMVSPHDVESISVIKDGGAAIYGVRGANGVVLIRTKTGIRKK